MSPDDFLLLLIISANLLVAIQTFFRAMMEKLLLLFIAVTSVSGIQFMLESGKRKCLKDEVHKNVLVTGDFEISAATTDSKVHLLVIDF